MLNQHGTSSFSQAYDIHIKNDKNYLIDTHNLLLTRQIEVYMATKKLCSITVCCRQHIHTIRKV